MKEIPMFPKPGDIKNEPVHVRIMKDGREICNQMTKAGRDEYERRKRVMWERQGRTCCLKGHIKVCPGALRWSDAMFEHQDGKSHGGGTHDDRIEKLNPKTGKMEPYNGVAHAICNSLKGSRKINYHEVI